MVTLGLQGVPGTGQLCCLVSPLPQITECLCKFYFVFTTCESSYLQSRDTKPLALERK